MATTDARPIPRKNAAYRHYFGIRNGDGSLITTWTAADSELSLDGGNYADATNEATEIQTSGTGYIELTAAEMNADAVVLKITVTNADALPYLVTLFPEEVGDIRSDVVQISGDAVAADNLELMFDGTGYAGGTTRLQVAAPDAETILDKLDDTLEDDGGTFRFTTNALEQAPTDGSSPTAIEIRQEIDANSTQLAEIVADTDELQQDDLPGLIAALNDISATDVNAEVDTALADIHLDHLLAVAETDTPIDGSIIAKLASSTGDWSTFVAATDSLQAIRDEGNGSWSGSGATAAEVRAEMDSNSTQLAVIVADTNEIQQDLVNGGRIDTILDSVLADTSQLQIDLADGGRLDLLIDAIKTKTDAITLTGSLVQVVLHDATAAGLATFTTVDTGETSAASGSVAELAGGTLDEQAIAAAVANELGSIRLTTQQQASLTGGQSLIVRQGFDYTSEPIRITIDQSESANPSEDLSSKKLIAAANTNSSSTKIAVRMPIEGSAGNHYADFDPSSAVTELWPIGTYNLIYGIEDSADVYRDLTDSDNPAVLTVEPFDIEDSDLVDI